MKKLLSLILAVCLLAGCSNAPASTSADMEPQEKTLIFADTTFNAENGEPDINPHHESAGWACMRYGVGEALFRYSDNMEIEPWLAKSYEMVDPLTWVITLQDNVTFTSGRAMDSVAVKECLEALVASHERANGDLCIDTITAENQTLTITTTQPNPALLNFLSNPYGCIFDVQTGITEEGIVSATGPYKAVSLETGSRLELVKNDAYWNGNPKIDAITILTISDGDTMTMALQSGEVDATYGMPYASYPLFENDDYTFSSCSTSRAFFAWMNFESSVIQDAAVRKAIALGIDKSGFVETLLNNNGYPANGVFPAGSAFGGDKVSTETYDPEQAKQILEAAGWIDTDADGIREKDGKALVIRWLTYPSRQELPLLAESAQATLKGIGISVEINCTADHNSIKANPAEWDVYASAMITAPTGDPEYFFKYCCLADSSTNNGNYHNEKLETLAVQLSSTFDITQRAALAVQMQQIILDDNAYVFCSHLRMSMIAKSNVTGLVAHPCDYYEITVDLDC